MNQQESSGKEKLDQFLGGIFGMCVGDSLGTTNEFFSYETVSKNPISDMVGGGKFKLLPGQFTDDSSMGLCLCESLIEMKGAFEPLDQQARYLMWYREGHLSSNGKCFDIGMTTSKSLLETEKTKSPFTPFTSENAAGNGSLMRVIAAPLLYSYDVNECIGKSGTSSRTTHGSRIAIDCCRYFAGLIYGALRGEKKEKLLEGVYTPSAGCWEKEPLHENLAKMLQEETFKHKQPPEIKGTGYVLATLEAVLWAFHSTDNFKDGALKIANIGDDADTTAAIFGQLAGVFYGFKGIPESWVHKIELKVLVEAFAKELYNVHVQLASGVEQGNAVISETYRAIHNIYMFVENFFNLTIMRKVDPCPKEYKTKEEYLADVKQMKEEYELLALREIAALQSEVEKQVVEKAKAGMMADYDRRLNETEYPKLLNKLSRFAKPINPFGGGNPFAALKKQ